MALYKDRSHVDYSSHDIFDAVQSTGDAATYVGIFRCTHRGVEIGIAQSHVLPPHGHSLYPARDHHPRWQLLVYAQHGGS